MIRHRLLLLAVLLVKDSLAAEEPPFKPIDGRVAPVVEGYLSDRSEAVAFGDVLEGLRALLGEPLLREKEREAVGYLRDLLARFDDYPVSKGIRVKRVEGGVRGEGRASLADDLLHYADDHVVDVRLDEVMESVAGKMRRSTQVASERWRLLGGNNAFLTGFALGFIAFGLKKLMLPFMIGVQIVKSVLFAMFLPSILGGLGKVVGEGVKYLASNRYPATGMAHNMGQMEDFEFKDPNGYDGQQYGDAQAEGSSSLYSYSYPNAYDYNRLQQQSSLGVLPAPSKSSIANRYTSGLHKLNYVPNNNHHGSFYTKHGDKHGKHQDYKVFHNIPPSSLLLTNYDPFYSPLLSRMDSVFKQLGYDTEACRERLICLMYKNPAKFAPYSNLISAQLSRELNELRKPSTDNPDILRFFKYMKAAKDGQDGVECLRTYSGCHDSRDSVNPPMVKTFNEINKLVHARKLSK